MATILLIDDDDLLRPMLRAALELSGHTVTEARNGREGVALYQANPPGLVITDLIMPDQEGIETIRLLTKEYPAVKIIAMSGGGRLAPTGYLTMARRLGAKATLAKPFSVEELSLTVADVLKTG